MNDFCFVKSKRSPTAGMIEGLKRILMLSRSVAVARKQRLQRPGTLQARYRGQEAAVAASGERKTRRNGRRPATGPMQRLRASQESCRGQEGMVEGRMRGPIQKL